MQSTMAHVSYHDRRAPDVGHEPAPKEIVTPVMCVRRGSNAIRVRRMTTADAAAVADLSAQLGYPCAPAAMRARIRELARSVHTVLLAAESADAALIGWAQAEERRLLETGCFAELTGLVVDEGGRGLGAGRALVRAAEAWARARGHATLRVRSNRRRTGARVFYERLGYEVFKTQNVFARRLRGGTRVRPLAIEGELGARSRDRAPRRS
jgi:GNAT superfamily N-acetyltransferase